MKMLLKIRGNLSNKVLGTVHYTSCRNYCEDETIRPLYSVRQTKGFYEERKTDETLTHAKTELGCNSETECKNIVRKEENFEKCTNFAKKNRVGERTNIESKESGNSYESKRNSRV